MTAQQSKFGSTGEEESLKEKFILSLGTGSAEMLMGIVQNILLAHFISVNTMLTGTQNCGIKLSL